MPKLGNRPPKYRLHRPSGQAVVTIQARDIYLGPWKSKASRIEYDRIIGEWLANGRQPFATSDSSRTITELVIAYWQFAERYNVKDGRPTCLASVKVALRFLRQHYGETLASDFGPLALKALQAKLVEAGHARSYVNSTVASIRRCFKWGVSQELVPVNVHQALTTVAGLRKGKTTARETVPVLPVADTTLPHLPPVVADMVSFQRLVGCRPGEVCNIRPCDVDATGEVWRYVPESHKTEHHGRARVIFIGPKAQDILRPTPAASNMPTCGNVARPKYSRRSGTVARNVRNGSRRTTTRKTATTGQSPVLVAGRRAGEVPPFFVPGVMRVQVG